MSAGRGRRETLQSYLHIFLSERNLSMQRCRRESDLVVLVSLEHLSFAKQYQLSQGGTRWARGLQLGNYLGYYNDPVGRWFAGWVDCLYECAGHKSWMEQLFAGFEIVERHRQSPAE